MEGKRFFESAGVTISVNNKDTCVIKHDPILPSSRKQTQYLPNFNHRGKSYRKIVQPCQENYLLLKLWLYTVLRRSTPYYGIIS